MVSEKRRSPLHIILKNHDLVGDLKFWRQNSAGLNLKFLSFCLNDNVTCRLIQIIFTLFAGSQNDSHRVQMYSRPHDVMGNTRTVRLVSRTLGFTCATSAILAKH